MPVPGPFRRKDTMSNSTNRFLDDVQRLATVRHVEQRASLERAVAILDPVAAAHGTLTYGELATRLGWGDLRETYDKLMRLLTEISETEDHAGRGMLSALAVSAHWGTPSKGYFSLARRLGREGTNDSIWRRERAQLQATWQDKVAPRRPSPALSILAPRSRGSDLRSGVTPGYVSVAFRGLSLNSNASAGPLRRVARSRITEARGRLPGGSHVHAREEVPLGG